MSWLLFFQILLLILVVGLCFALLLILYRAFTLLLFLNAVQHAVETLIKQIDWDEKREEFMERWEELE